MAKPHLLLRAPAAASLNPNDSWWQSAGGGWATVAAAALLLIWQLLRAFSRRRTVSRRAAYATLAESPNPTSAYSSTGIEKIVSDADLLDLIKGLGGTLEEGENWEDVVCRRNDHVSYKARCCRPKDAPPIYTSVTIFERCSTETLRDFYMDNEYRKQWDSTLIKSEQLQCDDNSGTEVGRIIKKFPLLTPREYILAWRVWEGKDKTFYCIVKDCEHPLAPQHKKYVRARLYKSRWCIKKVPARDACEIIVAHQEDNGMNIEMAKLAFAKGIWGYVCKMNNALREYSPRSRSCSTSILTMQKLIKKVPSAMETEAESRRQAAEFSAAVAITRQPVRNLPNKDLPKGHPGKWLANGLLLVGSIVCLSRGHSTLGSQLAMAYILKKLIKPGPDPGQALGTRVTRVRHEHKQDRQALSAVGTTLLTEKADNVVSRFL